MQTVNTKVNGCTLTCFDYLIIQLFLYLCNNFFYSSRMYASVSNKLMKGKTTNLTTYWVESRNNDCLRSIIYNNFNSRRSLKSTYITSFATNNASLYVVVINMEHRNRIFDSRFCCHTLYCLYDYLLCLLVGIELSLIHNLIDIACCLGLCLVLERFNKARLCLVCRKS